MIWHGFGAAALGLWTWLNLVIAYERLGHDHVYYYNFWSNVLGHLVLVAVPWALWWLARPGRKQRLAAERALSVIRDEVVRLGPAFDELLVEAECFWQRCGETALKQHELTMREERRARLPPRAPARTRETLRTTRRDALVHADRAVRALQGLGLHLQRARLEQVDSGAIDAHIDVLQQQTARALSSHSEAGQVLGAGAGGGAC